MYKRQNQDLDTPADVAKVQEHNDREKDSYSNQDIVPERTSLNIHFKAPADDYVKMFEQMEQDGVISTRGLKPDAVKYGELIFDVNSAYFYNHGGYEFAKQFYADAYKAAVEIVGGEQYILSAVMLSLIHICTTLYIAIYGVQPLFIYLDNRMIVCKLSLFSAF